MSRYDITHAIQSLCPGACWSIRGEDYSTLKWQETQIDKPTKAELDAEVLRLNREWERTAYQRQRKLAYPPVEDYLDAIVKGDAAQLQQYTDACLAVKAKYPKPE
jgi:hypothetical protein